MKHILFILLCSLFSLPLFAQNVTVSPESVNAYSQGATTTYLTFSNVVNVRPAEAVWCGEIISATPDLGFKCDPATIFGRPPERYNQSSLKGNNYTDIMSITPAVARRAYVDAVRGNNSQFFYVKHFIGLNGATDEFIPVTIRLSGNGAGVPFSLTAVKLLWQNGEKVVPFIKPSEDLPKITAEIRYTGTGRLKGRWEIVKPGEELPDREDLLTEATLAPEKRGTQRRYTLLNRFNINLPPGGKYVLAGPENWRIDKTIEGMYVLLLRIEASDASDSASNAGQNTIASGGVAGFSLPTMRYYVGNSNNAKAVSQTNQSEEISVPKPVILRWEETAQTAFYRVEIIDKQDDAIFSALVSASVKQYELPSFIAERLRSEAFRWRVKSMDKDGKIIKTSANEPLDGKTLEFP